MLNSTVGMTIEWHIKVFKKWLIKGPGVLILELGVLTSRGCFSSSCGMMDSHHTPTFLLNCQIAYSVWIDKLLPAPCRLWWRHSCVSLFAPVKLWMYHLHQPFPFSVLMPSRSEAPNTGYSFPNDAQGTLSLFFDFTVIKLRLGAYQRELWGCSCMLTPF